MNAAQYNNETLLLACLLANIFTHKNYTRNEMYVVHKYTCLSLSYAYTNILSKSNSSYMHSYKPVYTIKCILPSATARQFFIHTIFVYIFTIQFYSVHLLKTQRTPEQSRLRRKVLCVTHTYITYLYYGHFYKNFSYEAHNFAMI